jgi:hypothetical protein
MSTCPRPGVRRGPLRWSGGHPCRPLTPCTLAGVARARAGVRGRRGGPRLRQRGRWGGSPPGLAPRRLPGAGVAAPPSGAGRGLVAWRLVLRQARVGVSCAAWGRSAGSGGGQGRWQGRAPAGPGKRRGAWDGRAVVHGPVVPRAFHPGALRRVRRHGPRRPGRGGILRPGWRPRGWRQSVTGKPGHRHRSPATQQGFAGDGKQPPLVPRSGSFPRLKPGVRRRSTRTVAFLYVSFTST